VYHRINSVYAKLSLVLLGLLLVVGGATLALNLRTSHLYQQEVQQRIHRDLAQNIVKEESLIERGVIDEEGAHHVFHMMMVINPSIELYLLDPTGRILSFSAPAGRVKLSRVSIEPIQTLLSGRERLPILGDDPRHPERGNIFSAAPVVRDGEMEGYVYIVLASEQFVSVADMMRGSYILRSGAWAVAGAVAVTLLGGLLLYGRITRPLSRLTRDMKALQATALTAEADGDTEPRSEQSRDELDHLRTTFQRMATRIERQIFELEKQDRLRREMVANVSHDLRTPLAHLQGYLETLNLKEESLNADDRREYLAIALQQSERLGRLVSDLFELAKLDALEEPLERERLPVGELVQDVAQKYRLPAGQRGVSLEANLEGGLVWISADVGLMERALENVLDNALRYTPQGGRITISIEPHEDMLQIDVNDTGPGIAASELPHIFDRFHRASPAPNSEQSRGAGLGLAIARRAVELHGGNLQCESQLGQGTTFRFELPATGV
jgi:signal transduction histidine kinase